MDSETKTRHRQEAHQQLDELLTKVFNEEASGESGLRFQHHNGLLTSIRFVMDWLKRPRRQ